MSTGRYVAYYRVSTAKQGISGLGLEAQRESVMSYLNGGKWKLVDEVTEVESGKRNDRPQLAKALALCRIHNAELIIAKLDRLARNVKFIADLMESGVEFTAVDFPKANTLTVHILAAVAEHEAQMISQRTKAALRAAKARGVVLGGRRNRPVEDIVRMAAIGNQQSAVVRREQMRKRASDLMPVIQLFRDNGAASLRDLAHELNASGIPTARGGKWSAVQVMRLIKAVPS